MAIIVDYRCAECGVHEAFVEVPAPPQRDCAKCGGISQRRWSSVGIISRSPEPTPSAAPQKSGASLCAMNPDVPGLCHMSETAGRAWIARYRGDNRALDAEFTRQEKAAAFKTPTMDDAITHNHRHGTSAHEPAGDANAA